MVSADDPTCYTLQWYHALIEWEKRIKDLSLAAILVTSTQSVQAQVYTGIVVHIRDGDTFVIVDDNGEGEEVPVRLCGVDSPERGQKGYRAAKKALTLLIHGRRSAVFRSAAKRLVTVARPEKAVTGLSPNALSGN